MDRNSGISKFFDEELFQWTVVVFCLFVFIGFVCSRALVSIGMIGLLVSSLLFHGPPATLRKYIQLKPFLVLSLFFLVVLVSGIYSEDKENWLAWVRIRLPFLALPIAFAPMRALPKRKFIIVLYGFILTLFASAVVVLGNYLVHFQAITDSMSSGSQIPMPFSHIRYALMLVFAFFCCIYLFSKKEYLSNKNEKWLQMAIAVFIFIALHILSVRSALLALYLGLAYVAGRAIIQEKKFVLGGIVLASIFAAPFIAYKFIPSFQNKYGYMRFDIERYTKGEINEHSDAMRIVSMKIGLEIWKDNILWGVGAGDLKTETNKIYDKEYPEIPVDNRRIPHNQFIWVMAGTGAMGLVLFLFAFFLPFIANRNYKYWPLAVLYIIIFSSFFTEDTFEEQMGTGFYLIFLMLFMNRLQKD